MTAFEIGLREALEASVLVAVLATRATSSPAVRARFWTVVAASAAVGTALGVLGATVARPMGMAGPAMQVATSAVAVVMLTFAVRTTAVQLWSPDRLVGTAMIAPLVAIAVSREGLESTVFLMSATSGSRAAAVLSFGAGVATAVAGTAAVVGFASRHVARRQLLVASQAVLIALAAGLVMSALRTAVASGWLPAGRPAWVRLGWLTDSGAELIAAVANAFGVKDELSAIECIGWAAYVVVAVAIVIRCKRSSLPARMRALEVLP